MSRRTTIGLLVAIAAASVGVLALNGVPAFSAAPVVGHSPADRTYTVRSGDNLTAVSRRFDVSIDELLRRNPRIRRNLLPIGAVLQVPRRTTGLPRTILTSPERLRLRPVIRHWAAKNRVPADLLEATLYLESGWNQSRVSSTGAIGVGQLMPGTVTYIKRDLIGARAGGDRLRASVVEHNVRMSARYLSHLLTVTDGNASKALHRYYQGGGSIAANGLYDDTKNYAASVQALRKRFRADLTGL